MYAVFRTRKFEKEMYKKLNKVETEEVEKFEKKQLTENPYVGDPLGYPFFREKRIGGKRIYYLVYDELRAVLMIAISDKKTQQETIQEIKIHLNDYYSTIQEAIRQHDGYDRA